MPSAGAGPPFLDGRAILVLHARVVGTRGQSLRSEQLGDAQRRALQRHVDDGRARRPRAHPLDQQVVALAGCDRRHQEREVGAVGAGRDGIGARDAEPGADVVDDGGRRRRGEGEHPGGAQLARALRELEVVGTEVVTPLRDAVRLVDGEERDLHARELGHEALVVEALGRHVEQAELAAAQSLGDVAHLREREARVDARRRNAERRRARRSDPS